MRILFAPTRRMATRPGCRYAGNNSHRWQGGKSQHGSREPPPPIDNHEEATTCDEFQVQALLGTRRARSAAVHLCPPVLTGELGSRLKLAGRALFLARNHFISVLFPLHSSLRDRENLE
jgi:hypothetical protein